MRPFLVHEAKPVSKTSFWHEIRAYLGIERNTTRHSENCSLRWGPTPRKPVFANRKRFGSGHGLKWWNLTGVGLSWEAIERPAGSQ